MKPGNQQRHHRDHFRVENIGKWDAVVGGGVETRAVLTRCGVFTYDYGNELRHPDDVFEPESLATLRGAPVVIGHPGDVTSANWKVLAVGTIADDVRAERSNVAATIRVADAQAAEQVRIGALVELSCGYSCFVTEESGSYDGVAYATRQRAIRYNHVGMGPEGWGRAGPLVRMYLDSSGKSVQMPECDEGSQYSLGMSQANLSPILGALAAFLGSACAPQQTPQRTDGQTQPQQPTLPQFVPAVVQPQTPAADPAMKAQLDAARGEADAAKAKIAEYEKSAADKVKADAAAATAKLAADAAGHGVTTIATMNDRQIREAVIAKLSGVKVDGESDDYVRAVYDSAVRTAGAGNAADALTGARTTAADPTKSKGDEGPIGSAIERARMKQIQDSKDMWKNNGPATRSVRKEVA